MWVWREYQKFKFPFVTWETVFTVATEIEKLHSYWRVIERLFSLILIDSTACQIKFLQKSIFFKFYWRRSVTNCLLRIEVLHCCIKHCWWVIVILLLFVERGNSVMDFILIIKSYWVYSSQYVVVTCYLMTRTVQLSHTVVVNAL